MYPRTPGTREEGSLRPTQQGTALAKDVWLIGIGIGIGIGFVVDESARDSR
ncbi:hypothetical protein [Streptomyces incanus]|uniref:Uncharacterized protein n=1 Tax=Streptomyces incanus TaxID=887453 RepID=A0ABW0XRQ8_9ACTN